MPVAMFLDTSKCIGCRGCQTACKQWNQLSAVKTQLMGGNYENPPDYSGNTWTRVRYYEKVVNGTQKWLFLKDQCKHCTDASCMAVCPTGAIKRIKQTIVFYDQEACNGCKYCISACPYNVPRINTSTGTAVKCHFCVDRVQNGLEPACSKTCPVGAIKFGERNDLLKLAYTRIESLRKNGEKGARVYGEKELGGLGVFYIILDSPQAYNLPEKPRYVKENVFPNSALSVVAAAVITITTIASFRDRKSKGGD